MRSIEHGALFCRCDWDGTSATALRPRSFQDAVIAPVRVAGSELEAFFAPEPERCLQFQAHTHVRIGNTAERLAELPRLVLIGDELTIRNRKLRVVRWDDARLTNFFGLPAYMHHTILLCSSGESFGLPECKQCFNVLALQRAGAHLPETQVAQLPADHRQRGQSVGLRRAGAYSCCGF